MDHDAYNVFEDDVSQVTTSIDVQTVSPLDDEFLVINYNEFATIEDDLVSHITIPKLKLSGRKKKKQCSSKKKKTTIERTSSTGRSHKTKTTTTLSDNNKSKNSRKQKKKTKSKSTHRVVSIKPIIEEDEIENESNVSNPDEGIKMEDIDDPVTSTTIFERRSSDEINRTTSTKSSSNNSPKKNSVRGGRRAQNQEGRSLFKTTTPLSSSVPEVVQESLPHEDNASIMDDNNTLPSTLSLKTTTPHAKAQSQSSSSFDMVSRILRHEQYDTTTSEWRKISPTEWRKISPATDIFVPPSSFVYPYGKRITSTNNRSVAVSPTPPPPPPPSSLLPEKELVVIAKPFGMKASTRSTTTMIDTKSEGNTTTNNNNMTCLYVKAR
ncbi:hypothetical protein FRACYDRAFT_243787 [Fragilariopsis cylindrus CCMP1102]|uniref:Uncharacterized protein n=1 Tax=Fragilariopsis cylindrus CCMP1102 TaxID=635003 RepID=A0A1E7F3F6_9STRA|nr:hypothetical protein FRACYDRAFT_243787 [Fragilariopsis cylindrus CCMP1102]|eukprot:OEU12535.1 hypothetical protein FRACYDRAFT_243787 [Fragilariopsis cylindrus CCMP1102]